ncbi:hypothetical protein [Streptomyces sp. AGS-58]|uniref:hypothetical protein n=1 Tax=unclassified Streptomyces TaxID=2593676 RepID=UPI0035A2D79E
MRQALSRGMVVAATATGILFLYGGAAFAGSHAQGLAGVPAGSEAPAPVDPVDGCGDSVGGAAASNPASDESCAIVSKRHGGSEHRDEHDGAGYDGSDDRSVPGTDRSTPPYGGGGTTPPRHAEGTTPSPHGGGEATSPPHAGETTPPPHPGGSETTPPPYGGRETTPPPYGDSETTPPPYGDSETTPPPHGGGGTAPPSGGHTTPPSGGHTTPPSGGGGEDHAGQPPTLPHTGRDARTMIVISAASAALIAAGTVLYRRGRAASRR